MNTLHTIKTVLITGASEGIGRALAYEFASAGARVVAAARNGARLRDLCQRIESIGGTSFPLVCDVTKDADVSACVTHAVETLGSIDLAVLNAGIGEPAWLSSFDSASFMHVMDVNANGIARFFAALLPVMRSQGHGVIAGVTSLADVRGYPGSGSYCASKAAASIFLESARVELRSAGIRVVTIRPGFVRTAMTAKNEFTMPFLMSPEEAAKKIRRGIERGKKVVQFPFPIVFATWLVEHLPRWLYDRVVVRGRSG